MLNEQEISSRLNPEEQKEATNWVNNEDRLTNAEFFDPARMWSVREAERRMRQELEKEGNDEQNQRPLKLEMKQYSGYKSAIDGHTVTQEGIKTDNKHVKKKQHQADAKRKKRWPKIIDRLSEVTATRLAKLTEYNLVKSLSSYTNEQGELVSEDWFGDCLTLDGQQKTHLQLAEMSQAALTCDYDDWFSHADMALLLGEQARWPNKVMLFIDVTTTDSYKDLAKKASAEFKFFKKLKMPAPVKYASIEDLLVPPPTKRSREVGVRYPMRRVIAISRDNAYKFSIEPTPETTKQVGQVVLLQLFAESLVMSEIARMSLERKLWFSPPAKELTSKELWATEYFRQALYKKYVSDSEFKAKNDFDAYILQTPKDWRSQTIIAYYLAKLKETYAQFQKTRTSARVSHELGLLKEYCDFDKRKESIEKFLEEAKQNELLAQEAMWQTEEDD
ncbi:hypothetical protein IJI99_02410 [bacterium]|nr:hypothetical protein [bacterium]